MAKAQGALSLYAVFVGIAARLFLAWRLEMLQCLPGISLIGHKKKGQETLPFLVQFAFLIPTYFPIEERFVVV